METRDLVEVAVSDGDMKCRGETKNLSYFFVLFTAVSLCIVIFKFLRAKFT
jgi:hypothetical protein